MSEFSIFSNKYINHTNDEEEYSTLDSNESYYMDKDVYSNDSERMKIKHYNLNSKV
jgi:hypothetical protein